MNDWSKTTIHSEFVAGISDVRDFASDLPELAFVGKSNVGKSTLINRLTGQKKLARAGNRPGLTKAINLFSAKIGKEIEFQLADLPGYGYAKLGKKERAELLHLIDSYVSKRDNLRILCLLVDIRRDPGEDEHKIIDQCYRKDVRQIVVMTKCDTIKKKEIEERKKIVASALGLEGQDCILAGEKLPIGPLIERIALLLKTL